MSESHLEASKYQSLFVPPYQNVWTKGQHSSRTTSKLHQIQMKFFRFGLKVELFWNTDLETAKDSFYEAHSSGERASKSHPMWSCLALDIEVLLTVTCCASTSSRLKRALAGSRRATRVLLCSLPTDHSYVEKQKYAIWKTKAVCWSTVKVRYKRCYKIERYMGSLVHVYEAAGMELLVFERLLEAVSNVQ